LRKEIFGAKKEVSRSIFVIENSEKGSGEAQKPLLGDTKGGFKMG